MYVLTEQLHADGDPNLPFKRYGRYLERNKARFPASALKVATGSILNGGGRLCLHDAWLKWARFEEPAKGKRHQVRSLNLRVRLLSATHERQLELFYPKVFAYTLANLAAASGHYDWRYSELRLSKSGNVIHEVEWAGPPGVHATWVIEATDVRLRSLPLAAA